MTQMKFLHKNEQRVPTYQRFKFRKDQREKHTFFQEIQK